MSCFHSRSEFLVEDFPSYIQNAYTSTYFMFQGPTSKVSGGWRCLLQVAVPLEASLKLPWTAVHTSSEGPKFACIYLA